MKNIILFIVCCALITCSCSKEPEPPPKQQSRDSLSERLDIISQAREARQKENKAIESRDKLINDIFNKKQGKTAE